MGTYDRQRETARAKIAQYGRSVDLVTYADPVAPDPSKPWEVDAAAETVQTTSALFLTYDEDLVSRNAAPEMQGGSLIHEGDRQVILAASGLTSPPVVNGAVRVDGVLWKIVNVHPFSPNGEDILYTLQVRQ